MNLRYYNASNFSEKLKVTVHHTGKLGFTQRTATALGFGKRENNYIFIATDEDSEGDLYMINCAIEDSAAFKVNKAGDYYYANTAALFDEIGIDYKDANTTTIFDLVKVKDETLDIYKMNKRIIKKKTDMK